jgi:lipopolysaccharide transport system ATP-binding protein
MMPDTLPQTAPEAAADKDERQLVMDVRGLSKRYRMTSAVTRTDKDGNTHKEHYYQALKDVSFKVWSGDRVGIMGHNGAGKSTLLKILSRVLNPSDGEAFIYGRATSLLEVGTGFNPKMSGRQNVYLNAALHGLTRKEIDQRMDEIVAFSEIGRFIEEPVETYSTGMRARLGFSVAAHLDPDILMLDEVLSVGDAAFQKKCLQRMDEITGHDRTLLFVSHSTGAIRRFCDRCIWIDHGEVVMDDDVMTVTEAYEAQMMNVAATYQAPEKSEPAKDEKKSSGKSGKPDTASVLEAEVDGPVAELVTARVLDDAGQIARSVKIDTPCAIEIAFDVLQADMRVEPALHVKNEIGDLMFVVAFTDGDYPGAINKPGRYKSRARIPANLLNEGLHYVSVVMVTADPLTRHQSVDNAVSFSVYEPQGDDLARARGRYSRNFPGGLRPRLDWSTERES